jgi:hypothetical protein
MIMLTNAAQTSTRTSYQDKRKYTGGGLIYSAQVLTAEIDARADDNQRYEITLYLCPYTYSNFACSIFVLDFGPIRGTGRNPLHFAILSRSANAVSQFRDSRQVDN